MNITTNTFPFFHSYRGRGQQAALARGTTRRLRGAGVNAVGRVERSTDNDDDDDDSDEEQVRDRSGFDRLRSVRTFLSSFLLLLLFYAYCLS